ncbi:hypothetical protein K7X08_009318 [Anisodus acutangulus]|uniref:histidine kinase n=1 Tax=Anisodus acutangulus TaxID=402998 RepID=A0A9Q1MZ43_9SOLA|nr:hypothetical protein K7X08_009318 [Anisodus acutangulus]
MPFVSQISYVGQDRLMYSFYPELGHDDAQTFAVFTNSSSAMYYSHPVNRDTAMLYGQPIIVDAKMVGLDTLGWYKQSSKGTMGYASQSSIGIGLSKAKKFFNTSIMDGRAKISVGFLVQYVDDRFSSLNFYGTDFYLASSNGQVIVDTKIPHTSINVYNGTVSVQFKNLNGTRQDLSGNQSCRLGNGEKGQFEVKIKEKTHMFYCSVIEIAGLESSIERGVDLILDPADDSLAKFRLVKGDKVKIMQILSNLVSNAIRFTSEGHICVKASVRKPSKDNALVVCNRHSPFNCLTRLCTMQKGCCDTSNEFPSIQQIPNCMEFTFEVDDTGVGIPKDKQKYGFENFVQVKEEKTSGEEGYGLGLSIVQSIVHLMGGEIKIVDKEDGERGTRFQFNISLTTCVEAEEQEINAQNHGLQSYTSHHLGMQFRSSPPRSEGCHVVLFLTGEKRRKVLSRVIGNMNIKVSEVRKINELVRLLDRIKRNLDLSSRSLDKYALYLNLTTDDTTEVASGTKDTHDHVIPHCKRSNSNRSSNVILIINDSQAGHLLELSSSMVNFKKDMQNVTCKVVLLQDHVGTQENSHPPFDYGFPKPLHGKRLHEVLRLVSENRNRPIQHDRTNTSQEIECQELKEIVIPDGNKRNTSKDLKGKKVLVVDDQLVQRKYASKLLQKEGADVDVCENRKEAFDKVCKSLKDMSEGEVDKTYDFIMMDCEMPRMNGYQATRLIRKEEKRHGIHIPIIALTGHTMDDEMCLYIKEAGMDFPLTKPLEKDVLMNLLSDLPL